MKDVKFRQAYDRQVLVFSFKSIELIQWPIIIII